MSGTNLHKHLVDEHGYNAASLVDMTSGALAVVHANQPQPHQHKTEREAIRLAERTAQIAATSPEAYEAACDRFNAIAESYDAKRQELREAMAALDDEWEEAHANLGKHEDTGGIPLYNRCPQCTPGRALPAKHAGACR